MTRIMNALAARVRALRDEDRGFTLVELLIVVLIIGILAAIAIPIYVGAQTQSRDAAVKTDLGNAKVAVVASLTKGGYPTAGLLSQSATALASLGYTQSSGADYDPAAASQPTISYTSTTPVSFCIQAKAASGTTWAVSDQAPLQAGTCASGQLTPLEG